MNLLFDTNIILAIVRSKSAHRIMEYLNPKGSNIYVSFISIAEAQSIAFQNSWGEHKMQILVDFFKSVYVMNVSNSLLPTYIGIDAYSQCSHPEYQKYPFAKPRNMGKNDLWIAATASLLNLQLVTTDKDFDHLETSFLSLRRVPQTEIQKHFKN
ncbi:MAG: PIN domain-containing protein [Flammeovirgaceae bacterium]|jgi:tRNA(fMet)-specific endonuclease VapC|nr:PIN domain-containing protein [Flammeovirgaceae bacterium]